VCEPYPGIVRRLIWKGGFVVVTRCNWTEEELVAWFTRGDQAQNEDRLVVYGRVEYARFWFGGGGGARCLYGVFLACLDKE
jgi:hypothetical protein